MSVDEILAVIENERTRLGISWRELAEQAGTGHSNLWRWGHDKRVPRADLLIATLEALGYELTVRRKPGAVMYRCDPEKNPECKKTACYISGGPCMLTSKKEAAKDGQYGPFEF